MIPLFVRAVAACVALVGLTAWLNNLGTNAPSEAVLSLNEVLDQTARLDTVRLEVWDEDGRVREIVKKGNKVRIDNPDGSSVITNDLGTWYVKAVENRAYKVESTANKGGPVNQFFGYLGMSPERESLDALQKVEPRIENGVAYYAFSLPDQSGDVQLEAETDVATGNLRRLERKLQEGERRTEPAMAPAEQPAGNTEATVLNVLAFNLAVDDAKFVVQDTLTEDGRIGKIVDVQGLVSLRPATQQRWSPVCEKLLLKPGDWLRTDVRGANAAALKLVKSTSVIVGPGTQLELLKPNEVRLHRGELEITAAAEAPIDLLGPGKEKASVSGTQFYRLQKDKLVRLERPEQLPKWLAGFKGTTAHESIGSLTATVGSGADARSVPLSVDYHKVTVDIRDQIARTVIEESFINHTDGRLEGVFHFPLPADASISGFGMWIGDTLVEADVVEKQRAREIYETILREKRDPGLLEWAGGNIFKARVFPIEAQSEKRIKLVYTQVLPMRGGRYRYSYALQSELLKQNPLRELQLDVQVHSAIPLKTVSCPTHTARTQSTGNSASVEFAAQEYTPTRDFEVVVETERSAGDVALIPHRRGDDGYFLLQIMPPAEGMWERDVLPDAAPQNILLLADTSASMDPNSRQSQAEFVTAILSSLTPKDTFNLAVCDVESDWAFATPVTASPERVAAAQKLLGERVSLGWTDLDKAFSSAFKQAKADTHVIYVGDGISTTGDADPNAAADRIKRLYGSKGVCHAVIVGSSFESAVMNAIATLGGGSVRRVTGEHGPQPAALELMGEITRPSLRDVQIEFRGVRTAAVYPRSLPNLPPGSQQIVLGRYLPQGQDQSGEVVVTGRQGKDRARFATKVSLKDAEAGNEFIPRLWAKMHVDHLLEQGASGTIRDEIIALSEEFHIMTPYTSLLVLETDEDRERFKVKRRFQMRDGEQFFQEGRDNATYELARQQMLRAGDWRVGLRRSVLRSLATLGRNLRVFQGNPMYPQLWDTRYAGLGAINGPVPGGAPMAGFESFPRLSTLGESEQSLELLFDNQSGERDERGGGEVLAKLKDAKDIVDEVSDLERNLDFGEESKKSESAEVDIEELSLAEGGKRLRPQKENLRFDPLGDVGNEWFEGVAGKPGSLPQEPWGLLASYETSYDRSESALGRRHRGWYGSRWWETMFPTLGHPAKPALEQPPPEGWSPEALELSRSLLRTEQLRKLTGGLDIVRQSDGFDSRGDLVSRSGQRELVSAASWLTRATHASSPTTIQWCDAAERGVINTAFSFGRLRKPAEDEATRPALGLIDFSITALHENWRGYTATVERLGDDQTAIMLKHPQSPDDAVRLVIDTRRHVLLRSEAIHRGNVTSTTIYEDFVEVAGRFWARRIEIKDHKGRRTALHTQTIAAVTAEQHQAEFARELSLRPRVQFLPVDLPTVTEARRAIASGKGTFVEHLVLVLRYTLSQQWTVVHQHLNQCEKLSMDKAGLPWMRLAVLLDSRRHEDFKAGALRLAGTVAALPADPARGGDSLYLADHLYNQAGQVLQSNELLALLDVLKPVYDRQPPPAHGDKTWRNYRVYHLDNVGQTDAAMQLARELAEAYPRDLNMQRNFAQRLAAAGDYDAAYKWIAQTLASGIAWEAHEIESLRTTHAGFLETQGRFADLVTYAVEWAKATPENYTVYSYWLSALVRADRLGEAETLMTQWLTEGRAAGKITPDVTAKLHAAIYLAQGQGHNLYRYRLEPKWLNALAETAVALMLDETRGHFADSIMNDWRFRESDAAKTVRKKAAETLLAQAGTLSTSAVGRLVGWIAEDPQTTPEVWKPISAALLARWSDTQDIVQRDLLGHSIGRLLQGRGKTPEWLAFLRRQFQEGPEKYRAGYAGALFNALLAEPWTAEIETETFSLLTKMSDATEVSQRLWAQVAALHRLTDAMLSGRQTKLQKAIEHPEKLTRKEQADKQKAALDEARQGLADRLQQEQAKHEGPLGQWIRMERLAYEVRLNRDLPKVAGECWELLPAAPLVGHATRVPENEGIALQERMNRILQARAFSILMHLASRASADAALVERLQKYVEAGALAEGAEGTFWKNQRFALLVTKDKPAELQPLLRQWMQADDPDAKWRITLGYLLAEQGGLPEAIAQFEAARQDELLGPGDYRTLADWYLAVDRRSDSESSRVKLYQTVEDWRLSNTLSNRLHRIRQATIPVALDDEILLMFRAIFEKSESPAQHAYVLGEYYRHYRDFRLLASVADSVVGHSALKVYPFLQGLRSPVFSEVREEATVDQIVAHVAKVRERAKTPVDQRALDLIELMAERRATELQNQPGPHVAKALAAMQRAYRREWSPGEPRLMAEFLSNLGHIPQKPLADEQIHEADELHRQSPEGSADRVEIALHYSLILAAYNRTAQGADLLLAALREYEQSQGGTLPSTAQRAINVLIGHYESLQHYADGEEFLLSQLERPVHSQQRFWLLQRLFDTYAVALQNDGSVSLGSKQVLYDALHKRLLAELDTPDQNHRWQMVDKLCRVFVLAWDKKFSRVQQDLRAFAFDTVPVLATRQTNNYTNIVSRVADTVGSVLGTRDGLAFLITQIEREPEWFRWNNQDAWSQYSYRLAEWAAKLNFALGDLDPRLLKIVVRELQSDLESRYSRSRTLYDVQYQYFWQAKAGVFAKATEEVYERNKSSGAAAVYISSYLYSGLHLHDRAIEMLSIAESQKLLDESGQTQLANYLHERGRYGESIALLQRMIEAYPDRLNIRVMLLRAFFKTNRRNELLTLLAETDRYFHQENRWSESVAAGLAFSCQENELFEQSVAYFKEAITRHEATAPDRGIGGDTLWRYYNSQALAHAGLGQTALAVDSAVSAIHAWSRRQHYRDTILATLDDVLRRSRDLPAYIAELDKQAAATNTDRPAVRKAIGKVLLGQNKPAEAIAQLQIATTLEPNDRELYDLAVQAYENLRRPADIVRVLLEAIRLQPRSLDLYKSLGSRYAQLERPQDAERAYTSLVEMQPHESESHTALAEVRQSQNRWSEAISHWQRVVQVRSLEPTGLMKLAAAQLHEKQHAAAREALNKLRKTEWPERFHGEVNQKVQELEEQLK